MTEEEKKAIERAKFLVSIPTYLEKEMCKNLLNYIEKLQKENEKLKEQLKVEIYARDMVVGLNSNLQKENEELKEQLKEYEIGKEQE